MKVQLFLCILTSIGFSGSHYTGQIIEERYEKKLASCKPAIQVVKSDCVEAIPDTVIRTDTIYIPCKHRTEVRKPFKKIADSIYFIKTLGLDRARENYMFLISNRNKDSSVINDTLKEKVNVTPSPIKSQ